MGSHGDEHEEEEELEREMEKKRVLGEVKKQLRLAGPLILASSIQFILQLISNMFVGHLGKLQLAGASIATTFAWVTGFTLLIGMSTAMDTLCGQAYGAKQYHMLGIHMQRAMLVLTLVSVPVAVMWAFTDQILVILQQDHQIAAVAGVYARWMIPSLFSFGILQCYNRFLQTQNIVLPLLLFSWFTVLLHLLNCWIFVFKLHLGSKGAAIAISISYSVNVLLLAVYVKFSHACKTTWTGFSRKALHDVYNFVKLAVPSTGMICLQYWAFDVIVLLSGLLPNPKLATSVMTILLSTIGLICLISWGLSAAISTRVSNELGAGNPQAARFAVIIGVCITIVEGVIVSVVLICVRKVWGYAYTNERDVVRQIAIIMPLIPITHITDGINYVLQGTARGCGWQKICVFINLASYYIVGIPTSVLLAFVFHKWIKGLWIGMMCAGFVQASVLATMALRTDWNTEARKASDRVNESTISTEAA